MNFFLNAYFFDYTPFSAFSASYTTANLGLYRIYLVLHTADLISKMK